MSRKGVTTKERILAAASACILERGFQGLSVDEIAARAGFKRFTVYRHFGKRELLFEGVLVDRFQSVARAVKHLVDGSDTFEAAVVDGTLETLRLSNADPVYLAIAEAERALHLDLLMLGRRSALADQFLSIWKDCFAKALRDGTLRAGVSLERGTEWLRNCHFLLGHRTDLSQTELEALIGDFVMPGLVGAPR